MRESSVSVAAEPSVMRVCEAVLHDGCLYLRKPGKIIIIVMDWICMALFQSSKAPDRVPGSIHSHSVILVVVNYDSSHSCPGTD